MDINDLLVMITDGLTTEQAAAVRAAVERDSVKTKVSTIKAQSEYNAIVQKQQELQAALDGVDGRPGSRAYEKWYTENYSSVVALQDRMKKYEEKFGTLEAPTAQPQGATAMTKEEISALAQAEAQRLIQTNYAPQWSNHLVKTGSIIQKHMYSKRTNPIDFEQLGKLAVEKHQGNLEAAYDEWDRPEREKEMKATQEAEIERRVKEELQKRGTASTFPGGGDMTPGSLSMRTKADVDGFDPAKLNNDLVSTFMKAGGDVQ